MPTLDLFVFPGSTYSYLTVLRIRDHAAVRGFDVAWRPFDVRSIMLEMDNIPFAKKPIKARYMWRDIERRAQRHGLPFHGTPPYPVDPQLQALRVATVAAAEGWCGEFLEASYRAWFLEGLAPGVADHTSKVLSRLGRDPVPVLDSAMDTTAGERLAKETDAARALGIFGSPTFVVGQEIFWGDDRLEDAADWLQTSTGSSGGR